MTAVGRGQESVRRHDSVLAASGTLTDRTNKINVIFFLRASLQSYQDISKSVLDFDGNPQGSLLCQGTEAGGCRDIHTFPVLPISPLFDFIWVFDGESSPIYFTPLRFSTRHVPSPAPDNLRIKANCVNVVAKCKLSCRDPGC